METARIEQLPMNGRELNTLVATLPGLDASGAAFRAYGAPSDAMEFVVDGAVVTDRRWNMSLFAQQPGVGAIEEFTVDSNAVDAKYTRPTSIIVSTKNGTNQLHGTAYEVNRNNGIGLARARTDYYTKAPELNRNEYGFNLGGPVYFPKIYNGKNKTFWFFNYEGLRLSQYTTSTYNVPTDAERGGDFSGLVDTQSREYIIYDPLSTGPAPSYIRTPFPGNIIPVNRESPTAKYLFSITPEPSNSSNPLNTTNLYTPTGQHQRYTTMNIRLDHHFGDKDLVYGRYSDIKAPNDQITSLPGTNQVPGWKSVADRDRNASANWAHTISPNFFNELLLSSRYRIGGGSTGLSTSPTADWFSQLGMPNPFGDKDWPQFSSTGLGNYSLIGPGTDRANETFYVLDDNLTKVVGRHQLEFGGHLRYDMSNIHPNDSGASSFGFGSLATSLYSTTASTPTSPAATPYTGSNLANMYLGYSTYSLTMQREWLYLREGEAALYFQDNWRVNSRLTVNAGLRWEYWRVPREKNNALVGFDYANHAMVLGTSLNNFYSMGDTLPSVVAAYQALGLNFETYQQANLPQNLLHNQSKNFGPRLAFAYKALDGKRAFVLRGGYSISYFTVNQNNIINDYDSNTPLSATFSYNPYTDSTQSPNGLANYGLMANPVYEDGVNATNAVNLAQPRSITRGTATANFFDPNLPTSRVHTWNMTFEKEVAPNVLARARYIGTHGSDLGQTWQLNQATPSYIYYATTGQPLPTGAYSNVALRPYDQTVLGAVNEYRNTGWSNVQAFAFEGIRRYSKGYAFTASYTLSNAMAISGNVPTLNQYLPGAVPTDPDQLNRFLNYQRDTGIPKHEVKWTWLVDLPMGRGKALLHNAHGVLDKIVGGWQVAGIGTLHSTYFSLGAGNWNYTGVPVQYYGYKYPIQNCTVNPCQPGYLFYNGYIPADLINVPNGYIGIPASYKPYATPLIPWGTTALPANAPSNLNISQYWDTNNVWIPLQNGSTQIVSYNTGLNPFRNQVAPGPRQWNQDASLFKNIEIHERLNLRLTVDFFNVFNHPGNPNSVGSTGFLNCQSSGDTPRTMQLSGRLTW
jgi:hypothetical protein